MTSMRSSSGPGIVSMTFAVQMKRILERSMGTWSISSTWREKNADRLRQRRQHGLLLSSPLKLGRLSRRVRISDEVVTVGLFFLVHLAVYSDVYVRLVLCLFRILCVQLLFVVQKLWSC